MSYKKFAGDKKVGQSIFHRPERWLVARYVDKIPSSIETYHLTLTTIIWSLMIIVFSFLARENIHWLWGSSVMIFFQYITDLFDGAVGRHRNTGLIKWGFYMDHFLDYIFLASITIGYFIIFPTYTYLNLFIFMIFVAFMVNSFLSFAASNEFRIAYMGLGPTEVRLAFIIANTLVIVVGKTYLAPLSPYILAISFLGLIVVVYQTQKYLWKIDMDEKMRGR